MSTIRINILVPKKNERSYVKNDQNDESENVPYEVLDIFEDFSMKRQGELTLAVEVEELASCDVVVALVVEN